jgi:uncharacterized repeat protein (TIGR01451 family)
VGTITNSAQIGSETIERHLDDNRGDWTTWVDSTAFYADMVANKSGPIRVAAGEPITYSLSVHNSGGLTATSVLLTDSLPAGLTLISQDSPFTFSHPATDTLIWETAALDPYSPPVSWTVTATVGDGLTGTLTNTLSVTSIAPEAELDDNLAIVTTTAIYTPTVRLTAVHFDALGGGDEAVQIANLGNAPAAIGNWSLGAGESAVYVPPDLTLAPGEFIWLARNAADFSLQFGHPPDLEKEGSDPAVPDLSGGWPALAFDGDEVLLTDDQGRLHDVLVYKDGNPEHKGWEGPSLLPYHPGALSQEGQILYRKLDQLSGRPVPDSDTAADWAQETADPVDGRKVRYPGWDLEAYFQTTRFTQTAHLTVAVGPDALYHTLLAAVDSATRTLQIQSYTFENSALAQAVAARAAAGVSVTVLLDGGPAGGLSDQERWVCQEIEAAGGRCYFTIEDASRDIHARYAHQHAKYLIVDGKLALIGSENLSMFSMPYDDPVNGTAGQRGVYLITDAPGVVAYLESLYDRDLDPIYHRDIATTDLIGPPPEGYEPITVTDWTGYTPIYTVPLELHDEFAFEIIQSPENSLRDADSLLGLLARAGEGDTVLVQQMDEPLFWGEGDSNPADDPNLRLEAYLAAARRGVTVRVLLDGYFPDPPTDPRGNWATCAYLRERAAAEGLQLTCQQNNPTFLGIHNKMVLVQIDGRGYVHIGSINGTEISSKANRELALQVASDEVYAYLAAVFERDWRHELFLPTVMNRYGPADHPLISEVLYDPAGTDEDREWIELYNPTEAAVSLAGWMLGDAVDPADSEGMYLFPADTLLAPHQTLLVAPRGVQFFEEYGFYPDFELVETDPDVPNLANHPDWGGGYLALANDGDELLLLNSSAHLVDGIVWGGGELAGVLPHPGVELDGHSLERYPPWRDGDYCQRDFQDQPVPNPGVVP